MRMHLLRITIASGLLLCASPGFTQGTAEPITVPLSRPGEPISLEIELLSARIEVIGEDRKDAQLSVNMAGRERKIKTPSGTKTLSGGGGGLSVEEHDNMIVVDAEPHMNKVEIVARIPRRANVNLSTVNEGEIIVRNVTGTLQLGNVNGPITATNINGSVIAESINEKIRIAFSDVGKDGATSLTSLNGDISVAFPPNAGVELRIDNAHGQIESDLELDVKPTKPTVERKEGRSGVSVHVQDNVVATINGGGPVVALKTLNGNIRIEKSGQ